MKTDEQKKLEARERSKKWREANKNKTKEYCKKYYKENKDKKSHTNKIYREANLDKINEMAKKWREANPEKAKILVKKWYEKNKTKVLDKYKKRIKETPSYYIEKSKKWRDDNPEKAKASSKKWREANMEKDKEAKRKYVYNKKKTNVIYKLTTNIKTSICNALKSKNYKKTTKTNKILGCSYEEFKNHLESKFETWMTWNNYGLYNGKEGYGWDIDHIIPLSSAKSEKEVIKLNDYSNLQPLCSKINRDVKKNNF